MKFKIQPISDLITNSSSESFVIYTKEGIEILKSIVSELLGKDFDDYFMIHVNVNEYCIDDYDSRDEDEANLSLEDWCFKHCEDWNNYEGCPAIESIAILAKNPRDARTAELLNRLPYIFESETRYC